jgi:hypothetical protein
LYKGWNKRNLFYPVPLVSKHGASAPQFNQWETLLLKLKTNYSNIMNYNSSNATDPQHFKAEEYPRVAAELELLHQAVADLPKAYKAEIFISFLKDHSIKIAWILENPVVARQALSGKPPAIHIERLFTSCRQNTGFLREFEDYFKNVMSENQ